jgi:ABC-type multidrug transport system permease subunit
MRVWVIAKKDLRLLVRDRVAAVLLLGMPLLFILVLGLLLGENFGQKPDDTLRISVVDLDRGESLLNGKPWSQAVLTDLKETPHLRIEVVPDRESAERLIRDHRRAAVLVFEPDFSEQMNRCSFLNTKGSINPFHREGVYLDKVGATLRKDDTQTSTASVIEQVVQVTMLRVTLPFMIGQAFEKLSAPAFIQLLSDAVRLPMPEDLPSLVKSADEMLKDSRVQTARRFSKKLDNDLKRMERKLDKFRPLVKKDRVKLGEMIQLASGNDEQKAKHFRASVGQGVQLALKEQFKKYDLTGKTWADLTKSKQTLGAPAEVRDYEERGGAGLLRRGAHRYQVLVPSYTVMFAFFLVLTVGWVFVGERRQGTLARLRAAPLTRAEVLLGKLLPCFAVSLGQGLFLLAAGRLLFGMRWGPDNWSFAEQVGWLSLVVFCTSLAAMGLALLVAALARTEMQVAIFGALPVLVLALIGGCVLPRELMPEQTQRLSLLTPQGWALDAYRELLSPLGSYQPNLRIVLEACGVLSGFGVAFLALAWRLLRLN